MKKTVLSCLALLMGAGVLGFGGSVAHASANTSVVYIHNYDLTKVSRTSSKAVRVYKDNTLTKSKKEKLPKNMYTFKSETLKRKNGTKAVYRFIYQKKGKYLGKFMGVTFRKNVKGKLGKTIKSSTGKPMNVKANPKYHASTVATNVPTKALTMGKHSVKPITTKVSDVNVDARTNMKGVNGLATLRDRINKLITIANEHPDAWKNVKEYKNSDPKGYQMNVFYAISDLSDTFHSIMTNPARDGQGTVDSFNKQAQKMISEANY